MSALVAQHSCKPVQSRRDCGVTGREARLLASLYRFIFQYVSARLFVTEAMFGCIALWLNAREFGHSLPLVSLALLAMSPSLIRWGGTVRGYGLGLLLILVTCALLWRFADRPGTGCT